MVETRRSFILGGAAALAASRAAAQGLVIQPNSPWSGQTTLYAKMANQGSEGLPESSVRLEISKSLRLDVWLPPRQREARAIIFSHGELGVPQVYSKILAHWASHGFAVIAPTHDDSVMQNGIDSMAKDNRGKALWDIQSILNDPRSWDGRVAGCRAAIDAIPVIEQATRVRILDERIIVAGHSLGAYTAQLMLGAHVKTPSGLDYAKPDERIYGGILLSAQGRGILGLQDNSWDAVKRPFLLVTGNGDTDATGQDPNVKLDPFSLSPAGNRHLAWFSRISPSVLSGQQVTPGSQAEIMFGDLLSVTTGFLTAYGTYDPDVFQNMAGDYFEKATNGRVVMRYR